MNSGRTKAKINGASAYNLKIKRRSKTNKNPSWAIFFSQKWTFKRHHEV